MKSRILLPLLTYPDPSPIAVLARALDLAATLGAEVTAIVHEVDIPPIAQPFPNLFIDVKAMSSAAESLSRARGAELAQAVQRQAERIALPLVVETFRHERLSGELIASRARTYDLTFLVCQPDSSDHALIEEEVLFRSGGPVVVFPAEDGPAHLSTVAIAWDGSRAAARALRDALGVLGMAGRVVILTAGEEKSISPASVGEVLSLLKAHGILAEHREVPLGADATIGDALQTAAIAERAGLLVMGAYGHTRMREFVLGGATKSVLRTPRLSILMSH